jgi:hypothetical protein
VSSRELDRLAVGTATDDVAILVVRRIKPDG